MKIAVTSQNLRHVTGHAGMCRNFLLFDVDEQRQEIKLLPALRLSGEETFHAAQNTATHPLDGVQYLISGGMGQGLVDKLLQRGIQPVLTQEIEPLQALKALLDGTLQPTVEARCEDPGEAHPHAGAGHACGCRCGH